jgi:hypothetical protein
MDCNQTCLPPDHLRCKIDTTMTLAFTGSPCAGIGLHPRHWRSAGKAEALGSQYLVGCLFERGMRAHCSCMADMAVAVPSRTCRAVKFRSGVWSDCLCAHCLAPHLLPHQILPLTSPSHQPHPLIPAHLLPFHRFSTQPASKQTDRDPHCRSSPGSTGQRNCTPAAQGVQGIAGSVFGPAPSRRRREGNH